LIKIAKVLLIQKHHRIIEHPSQVIKQIIPIFVINPQEKY
jgi:hypothetical protein